MKRRYSLSNLAPIKPLLVGGVTVACFLAMICGFQNDRGENTRQRLEDALRRAAVSCYAEEGFYPPDLEYIEKYYGVIPDKELYAVHYEIFAENLMPQITVVELQ